MIRALVVFLALPAFCQQAREFEVASIKTAQPDVRSGCDGGPGTPDPTRLTCRGMTASTLVGLAYGVSFFQIKGPDWLTAGRFDVNAVVPAGLAKDQLPALWQRLLENRFHLAVHRESRNSTVYDLVVAKGGSKLIPAAEADKQPRPVRPAVPLIRHISTASTTTGGIARVLQTNLQLPVHDATHLDGEYMMRLAWNSEALGDPPGPSLEDAVEELGLHLEAKKGTMDIVIVDHMDRTPSGN